MHSIAKIYLWLFLPYDKFKYIGPQSSIGTSCYTQTHHSKLTPIQKEKKNILKQRCAFSLMFVFYSFGKPLKTFSLVFSLLCVEFKRKKQHWLPTSTNSI